MSTNTGASALHRSTATILQGPGCNTLRHTAKHYMYNVCLHWSKRALHCSTAAIFERPGRNTLQHTAQQYI